MAERRLPARTSWSAMSPLSTTTRSFCSPDMAVGWPMTWPRTLGAMATDAFAPMEPRLPGVEPAPVEHIRGTARPLASALIGLHVAGLPELAMPAPIVGRARARG